MSIILSCGHATEDLDEGINVSIKAFTIGENGWQKAIEYKTVCKACYEEYKAEGYVLDPDQEVYWLIEDEEKSA